MAAKKRKNRAPAKGRRQESEPEVEAPEVEKDSVPARDDAESLDRLGEKPSILRALKSFTPPAPMPPGMERASRTEVAL